MYLDEVPLLLQRIERRRLEDEQRRLVDKLHAIETATIPHRDPKKAPSKLPRDLQSQLRRIDQLLNPSRGAHLDRAGVAALKALVKQVNQVRR